MRVKGTVELHGLSDWWRDELTEIERTTIVTRFQPLGGDPSQSSLVDIEFTSGNDFVPSPTGVLSPLPGWLNASPDDAALRRKLREKLSVVIESESDLQTQHFGYQVLIQEYYRVREADDGAFDKAIAACEAQISMSTDVAAVMRRGMFPDGLPAHHGFEQLAIVREKQRQYASAIDLCKRAQAEGWRGDWEKRIERCKRRALKTGVSA